MIDTKTVDDDQDLINHYSNYYSAEDFNSKFNSNLPNSESVTNNYNSPAMFNLHNYELLRADRARGKGGGVGMYIHDQ